MAGSEYYDHTTYPSQGAAGSSAAMRSELGSVENGFGKLPGLAGNGGKIVVVNAGGTALEATSTPALGAATGTSFNGVTITPVAAAVLTLFNGSTLATSGAFSLTLTATAATNITLPTTGTLATLAGTETLTNKTLTSPAISSPTGITATNIANTPAGGIAATTVQAALNELDTEKAKVGANSDITSLSGLTTPITVAQGGRRVGSVFAWPTPTAPANSMALPLVATNVSRTTYAALFAAIGTAWGVGDGSTTFGIPWVAADNTIVQANANVGTSTVGEVISHLHLSSASPTSSNSRPIGSGVTEASVVGTNTGYTGGSANLPAGSRFLWCIEV